MIGARVKHRLGARVGQNAFSSAVFARDATSGKAAPASPTEWSSFLASIGSALSAPQHLWLLQEAAGNPVDTIGAKTLTATTAGNAPAYQKAIAGWSRKAIGGSGAAVNSNLSNAVMVNTATTSFLLFAYARFDPPPVSLRALIGYGTPSVQASSTNKIRLREGAALIDSTNNHNAVVHPLLFAFNVTASTVKLYTDLEKLSVAFSASAGSTLTLTTSSNTDTSVTDFLYAASWDGAAGETTDVEAKKLITGLGFTPPWS